MYNKYSEFSLYGYWIVLIFKHFQIQIRVWRWLFESLYKRTRREISLWQTWLWILWYSNATCCQNRGSQISITIQGKKQFYDSYHILIKFGFFLILIWVYHRWVNEMATEFKQLPSDFIVLQKSQSKFQILPFDWSAIKKELIFMRNHLIRDENS